MEIELMDQPILIIKSAAPSGQAEQDFQKEALIQIESLLQEEISDVRQKIKSDDSGFVNYYLTEFNLHLQTEEEVVSVVLESEWQEQMGTEADEHENPEEAIDLKVSDLMRVVKISYTSSGTVLQERKKLYEWLAKQNQSIPFICGLGSRDYLLISAKEILNSMSHLRNIFA